MARNMRCNQNRLKNYTLIELEVRWGLWTGRRIKGAAALLVAQQRALTTACKANNAPSSH